MSGVIKNRIYVGQMAEETRESDLKHFLRGYGDIEEIRMMKGYAFVEFEEESDAEDAIYELDGKMMNGETVRVDYAKVPRARIENRGRFLKQDSRWRRLHDGEDDDDSKILLESPWRLLVKNLSKEVSWQDLKDLMRRAGDVTFTSVHRRLVPGQM